MFSLETYPALYLAYQTAPPASNPSSSSSSSSCRRSSTLRAPASGVHSSLGYTRGPTAAPPGECRACGVPLRVFRKCCSVQLPENMTAHLCITTYRSPDNSVLKLELCFVGQDCQRIPSILGATYGLQTKRLDLSYNAIRSLEGLEKFPYLEELVLDNNYIDDSVTIPYLETLHTLSLNKNKITNLDKLLDQVSEQLPNLRYLSLLGNVACPDQLSCTDTDEKDYKRYRLYVLHRLPSLKFLDSTHVRRSELKEAKKRGALSKVIRPGIDSAQNSLSSIGETLVETSLRGKRVNGAKNGTTMTRDNTDAPSHQQRTGAYGVRRYKYIGHHSEGNRFIRNEHL